LIHETSLGGNSLVQDQIPECVLACGHALRLLGQPLHIRERAEIT